MNQLAWVLVPVWISLAAWFVGAVARFGTSGAAHRWYAWCWVIGSVAMWVHIVGSYAVVHGWSHAAAIEATAAESERVTGIRAGWGVYVNFVFAILWSAYSVILVRRSSVPTRSDAMVFWFIAAMVSMSTVVFEQGWVRWIGIAAILFLVGLSSRRVWGGDRRDVTC